MPVASNWKWLHPVDGTDPATSDPDFHQTFFLADYDDSRWQEGTDSPGARGGFGYGDPVGVDIGTPDPANRRTAYFRHKFNADYTFEDLIISMQRDDGVVVYLDGVEVGRDNVGDGQEEYSLFAQRIVTPGERLVNRFSLSGKVESGEHVLAISLHNMPRGSTDLRIAEIALRGRRASGKGTD